MPLSSTHLISKDLSGYSSLLLLYFSKTVSSFSVFQGSMKEEGPPHWAAPLFSADDLEAGEVEGDLFRRGLGGVRPVDRVLADGFGELGANGAHVPGPAEDRQ